MVSPQGSEFALVNHHSPEGNPQLETPLASIGFGTSA